MLQESMAQISEEKVFLLIHVPVPSLMSLSSFLWRIELRLAVLDIEKDQRLDLEMTTSLGDANHHANGRS
jgi:hypothetical protein